MTERALPELPGGWVWTKLGRICFTTSGGTPSRKNKNYFDGNIPWLKSGELNNGIIKSAEESITEDAIRNSSTKIIPKGTLLIALYGATVGKLGILGIDAAINQAVCAIYTNNSLDYKFLFWYLSSYRNELLNARIGGAQPNISQQIVNDIPIPLPPHPEQCRIVTKIEELFTRLDAGVSELKKTQAQLKRYRQSVLKAACEGKIVPTEAELVRAEGRAYEPADVLLARILKERREKWNGKGKYKEPAAPDTSGLPALPEGWGWATYEQIGKWSGGGTPSTIDSTYWKDGTIPWISPKDMKCLRIHDSKDKITEVALDNSSANLIPSGSILFVVRSGILRRTLPVALTTVDATVNQDIKSLTPLVSIDADYLLVTALAFNEDIRHSCAKDGTTVESIEVPALQIYAIPLPPLAEQHRIVLEVERRISIADEVTKTVEHSLAQSKRLRQSILKKAFEGRLVAQDASDEPAGVLLERIKVEKMHTGNGTRKSKQSKLSIKDVA